MKVDLEFERKGDKFILTDKSVYSEKDLIGLYNTFKMGVELKKEQLKKLEEQRKMVYDEFLIMGNRYNQLKKYLKKEKIEIPKEENK